MTPEQIVAEAITEAHRTGTSECNIGFLGEYDVAHLTQSILKALRDAGYLTERCPSNTREYTKEEMIEMFCPPEKK